MRPLIQISFLTLLASSFALAQGAHQHGSVPAVDSAPLISSNQPFDALMAHAMDRMHAAMVTMPTTGQPDRDFLAAMIPHHQGAIDMAKAVLLVTQDPRVRNLAQSIITEQQYEIELMRTLLAEPASNTLSNPENKP